MPRSKHRGFTLIEAMVVVAIIAVVVAMAAPSVSAYSENAKVRGATESFLALAQQARLEAIRTNQDVELVMTNDEPTAANVNTTNTSASAGNWLVRRITAGVTPTNTFVEGRSIREGSNRTDAASTVTVSAATGGTALANIIFSSAGTTSLGAVWDVNFGSSTGACAPAGSVRCLRVKVTVSGQIRACDPAVANTDTRFCW